MTNVLLEKKGHIAVATINRPKALNALNSQVLEDIDQLVEQVKADDEIRALVITGSGEKAFVAGADIGEMSTLTKARRSGGRATGCRPQRSHHAYSSYSLYYSPSSKNYQALVSRLFLFQDISQKK